MAARRCCRSSTAGGIPRWRGAQRVTLGEGIPRRRGDLYGLSLKQRHAERLGEQPFQARRRTTGQEMPGHRPVVPGAKIAAAPRPSRSAVDSRILQTRERRWPRCCGHWAGLCNQISLTWPQYRQDIVDDFLAGGGSSDREFEMSNGPTGRKRGDIWPQLGTSVCMLLALPLVITAGVIVFGSSPQGGSEPEGAAQQAAALETTVTKSVSLAKRPDRATSFALASAAQPPAIIEQHAVAEERPATEQPPITAWGQASGEPRVAKDPSRYDAAVPTTVGGQPAVTNPTQDYGPITVTLVHVQNPSEQSAIADIDAAPSIVRDGHASRAVTRIHASHASRRMGRHGSRSEQARLPNEPRRMASVAGSAGIGAGVRREQGYQSRKVRLVERPDDAGRRFRRQGQSRL
jgi:hypothetical protein